MRSSHAGWGSTRSDCSYKHAPSRGGLTECLTSSCLILTDSVGVFPLWRQLWTTGSQCVLLLCASLVCLADIMIGLRGSAEWRENGGGVQGSATLWSDKSNIDTTFVLWYHCRTASARRIREDTAESEDEATNDAAHEGHGDKLVRIPR